MKTPSQPTWAVMPDRPLDVRTVLTQLYWAAVKSVSPGPALRHALERLDKNDIRPRVWIFAMGKAANPMAIAAVDFLAKRKMEPVGGVIVSPRNVPPPHESLTLLVGDHPLPGANSLAAAKAIGNAAGHVQPNDEVWVLLSGGATSLIAGPDASLRIDEMHELFDVLLGSGLDIATMNLVRKRFTRWGAGKLAVALAPARVRNFIMSDVIGDDFAAIGSGPCTPDPSTASQIITQLKQANLFDRIPLAARRYLAAVERDPDTETPKAGAEAFVHVERKIIASNRIALEAAAARAREFGYEPRILGSNLAGEAAATGAKLAGSLLTYCGTGSQTLAGRAGPPCLIWGGETTVTLVPGATGTGGRCQELALAAARELAGAKSARTAALLACGTDGRDGPTDAAGAIVDTDTWNAIGRAGREPAKDLAAHDAYPALDAAGALLRTDLTATNVMDVVIGVCGVPPAPEPTPRSIDRVTKGWKRIVGRE